MEEFRRLATISVARGCSFAALAGFTIAVALSFDPNLATRAAALFASGLLAVLLFKAWHAPRTHYRSTEVWVMLERDRRPPEELAQRIIGGVLRDTYMAFANIAAAAAVACWLLRGLVYLVT